MKKALIVILAVCMIVSAAFAEESSPFPFGISADASSDDVAAILSPVFGEIITPPGFEDKTWGIAPENKYLYDFLIDDIQLYINNEAWKLEFRLVEENPYLFTIHLLNLYDAIKDQFGLPSSALPEMSTYDLSGNQTMRNLFEEPSALEKFLLDEKDSIYYSCNWEICSLTAFVFNDATGSIGNSSCTVHISWNKESKDAPREEAAP